AFLLPASRAPVSLTVDRSMSPSCGILAVPVNVLVNSKVLTLGSEVSALVRISLGSVSGGAAGVEVQAPRMTTRLATRAASMSASGRRVTGSPWSDGLTVDRVAAMAATCQTVDGPGPAPLRDARVRAGLVAAATRIAGPPGDEGRSSMRARIAGAFIVAGMLLFGLVPSVAAGPSCTAQFASATAQAVRPFGQVILVPEGRDLT